MKKNFQSQDEIVRSQIQHRGKKWETPIPLAHPRIDLIQLGLELDGHDPDSRNWKPVPRWELDYLGTDHP